MVARVARTLTDAEQAALRSAYADARATRHATARPATLSFRCRYCGEHRADVRNSPFDGHSRCVITSEFALRVLELTEHGYGMVHVAAVLGVSKTVLGVWTRVALDARSRRHISTLAALEPWVRVAVASQEIA
jgi:transposase-like protein